LTFQFHCPHLPYIAFFFSNQNIWKVYQDVSVTSSEIAFSLLILERETFENIYLDLSKQSGKCRFAESGLGWKPSGGGDTFTLDAGQISAAQWSRASKGYELKILSRNVGVIQLDGFEQEVRWRRTGDQGKPD
jgi:POB3-like N-terminal PH domain